MASTNRDEISRLELLHAAHPDGLVFPHLADAYRRAGRFAQAESVLNAGLRRHADYSSAHVVLGRLRLDQGKRREAKRAFQRVLQLEPRNHVALEMLGRLAAEEGRPEAALPYFRRLASVKPSEEVEEKISELEGRAAETRARSTPPADGVDAGRSHDRDGDGDREGATSALPEPGEVVTETMAELYMRQGLFERAAAVYRQLRERDPGNPRLEARLEEARSQAQAERDRATSGLREGPPEPSREPDVPIPSTLGQPPRPEPGRTGQVPISPPFVPGAAPQRTEPRRSIGEYLSSVLAWPSNGGGAAGGSGRGGAAAGGAAGDDFEVVRPSARSRWRSPQELTEFDIHQAEVSDADPQMRALIALSDILVGLLEYRDPFFRGSSSLTRLLAASVAEEMDLSGSEKVDLALAAVLRDLGRLAMGGRLVESPKVSETPEGRRKIERHVDLALQLMEGIRLPERVILAVRYHHERWDGTGYPDGLAGEKIPRLARILAVVDSFAAMVSPRPYRLPRKVPDAARELQEAAGTGYDPAAVSALLRVVERRDQAHLAFVQRHHILLVDPDQPGGVVTAAKLCSAGYLAEVAVEPDTARERLRRVPVSALVLSARTRQGDAESLIRELRMDPLFAALPIVVVEAETVPLRVRLLESGADVCFPPGVSYGELQGTLGALVRRTVRATETSRQEIEDAPWLALQGDLQDFPLAWLLQVMKYDSRTAGIGIRTATGQGAIYIESGDAVHAHVRGGPRGEEALKEMLQWDEGRFTVQPDAQPGERTIETSIMQLLLTQAVEEDHEAAGIFGAISDHP